MSHRPDPRPLNPLLDVIRDLIAWMDSRKVEGVLIGGVAASLLGRPRTTLDVDAVVWLPESRWKAFIDSGRAHGFLPRLKDPIQFARQARILLLQHAPSWVDVDISLGSLPFEKEAIEKGERHSLMGLSIPLPRPEDLVVMKAVAHRPRDWADIEGILEAHPRLDRERVRRIVREFAEAMEDSQVLDDLERVLARIPPR